MNTFLNEFNYKLTENGGVAHATTNNAVYDMFALGAAYRHRLDNDVILLFKNALEYDETLALKCLFYIRDVRGGQGERRFFRVAYKWLAQTYPKIARRNLEYLSEYGRWDDLIYICLDTPLEKDMLKIVMSQLILDLESETPSLLAKWVPSENASSYTTRHAAAKLRQAMRFSHKEYRKMLALLRSRKAGFKYKNAFARRDIIAKKYEAFMRNEKTTVNAKDLYPYEIVAKAAETTDYYWNYDFKDISDVDRVTLEKYWQNLPDYLNGQKCNMMCVVDTSGSMTGDMAAAPINVAISLGMYCAERIGEPFKNHYISFSSRPQMIKIEGIDFVDKVRRIYKTNLCENTNLTAVFDLILSIAKRPGVKPEDIPSTLVVISDMEIDHGTTNRAEWTTENAATEMEKIREKYAAAGVDMPRLVYWNVDARNNTILDSGPYVSFVSGMSPILFEQVLTGKNGWDLCCAKLLSERYEVIN